IHVGARRGCPSWPRRKNYVRRPMGIRRVPCLPSGSCLLDVHWKDKIKEKQQSALKGIRLASNPTVGCSSGILLQGAAAFILPEVLSARRSPLFIFFTARKTCTDGVINF